MKHRSKRDLERLQYEAERAQRFLALLMVEARVRQDHQRADAFKSIAVDLKSALDGKRTGFDWAGGRGEWVNWQRERDAA